MSGPGAQVRSGKGGRRPHPRQGNGNLTGGDTGNGGATGNGVGNGVGHSNRSHSGRSRRGNGSRSRGDRSRRTNDARGDEGRNTVTEHAGLTPVTSTIVSPRVPSPTGDAALARTQGESAVTLHQLHCPWTLYYHSPTLQDWSTDSYMEVATFDTAEAYWALFDQFSKEFFHMGMFFYMREGIKPTWEDERNRRGGCWSFKIPMRHIYTVWRDMVALLVGESLSSAPMLLNGISVSPKRGFCIVKVWGHDSKRNDTKLLRVADVEHVDVSEVLYASFREKK